MLRMGNVFLQIPLHLLSRLFPTETHIFIFRAQNLVEKSRYYFHITFPLFRKFPYIFSERAEFRLKENANSGRMQYPPTQIER